MSTPIQFRLTAAGQQAAWNAQNTGLSLELTHVQFGSGNRAPNGSETALLDPKKSVPIAAGSRVSASQIRLSALLTGADSFAVSEIGIWTGKPGTSGAVLFAYWSQPSGSIAAKAPGVDFIFSHDMALGDAVAANAVTVVADTNQSAMLAMLERHRQDRSGHPLVTASEHGYMSATDKKALDDLLEHVKTLAPISLPMFRKRDADLRGGQISLQAADNQQYKDAHIDFHGARMHLYATRKSDGTTVGGYIDLAQIGEGFVCLSDMAPAGLVSYFAGPAAPSGWMLCNGAAISRTVYARLFAAIGTLYGPGDGSTTFALPDLRGEFIRGWDAGRGVDSGRTLGSHQGDAIRNITGFISGTGGFSYFDSASGALGVLNAYGQYMALGGSLSGYNDINFDASRAVPTATENRPRNVALLPCIKY